MQGFGPVRVEPREPVFHAPWEERVFGVTAIVSLHGLYSVNAFRHAIERMDPAHYLGSRYYEHWLTGLATLLVERGVIEDGELAERAGGPFPLARPVQAPRRRAAAATTETQPAPFATGDRVRVRDMHPRGHTRCPRYVRGKRGIVERLDGAFELPDAELHADAPPSEPTYCVRFDADELWGAQAEPGASVSVDLWHSYLERA
jgi:nitrile hydratase subunit beta